MKSGLITAMTLLAGPALAGEFTPPEGCEGWLTVQHRSCQVANYYSCAADGPDIYWRVLIWENDETFLTKTNNEFELLEHYDLPYPIPTIQETAEDPSSISNLLETSEDRKVFTLLRPDGTRVSYNSREWLTGEEKVVDGVRLLETEYEGELSDSLGSVFVHETGKNHLNTEWRILFNGAFRISYIDGTREVYNLDPVEFILPGEFGFFSDVPKYDCGTNISLNLSERIKHHDF